MQIPMLNKKQRQELKMKLCHLYDIRPSQAGVIINLGEDYLYKTDKTFREVSPYTEPAKPLTVGEMM